MVQTRAKTAAVGAQPHYEFGGPIGAFGVSFGLPIACYAATFLCNDIAGCPIPSALHPWSLSLETLKEEAGWPEDGFLGLMSFKVTAWVLAYYGLSLVLQAFLPGVESEGVELASGGKLKYKLNSFNSALFILVAAGAGTIAQGAEFPLWTFIYDNYLQILSTNIVISYILATYVYLASFSVTPNHHEKRELAAGGHTGNVLYDWYIGRELNPRITLPLLGEIDIKEFCELRPGMLGWAILDLTFVAHQYSTYGYVTDSILLVTLFQIIYVIDSIWMEPAVLTMMDITTDGFGFMLAFGDLVWVPFIYSLQCKYLAVYPVHLGLYGTLGVLAVNGIGYYIFRSSNSEKNAFRVNPNDPALAHLEYIETKSGSKLLVSSWWGMSRHPNYFGDWIMAWAWCLPTGLAGYLVQQSSSVPGSGKSPADGSIVGGSPTRTQVVQGEARGWGVVITYFYVIYFAVLLLHRERRDEEKCQRKYGDDWKRYQERVRWRIFPGVY